MKKRTITSKKMMEDVLANPENTTHIEEQKLAKPRFFYSALQFLRT